MSCLLHTKLLLFSKSLSYKIFVIFKNKLPLIHLFELIPNSIILVSFTPGQIWYIRRLFDWFVGLTFAVTPMTLFSFVAFYAAYPCVSSDPLIPARSAHDNNNFWYVFVLLLFYTLIFIFLNSIIIEYGCLSNSYFEVSNVIL